MTLRMTQAELDDILDKGAKKAHKVKGKDNKYKQMLELIFLALKVEPVREYRFCQFRRWRFDYAFPDKMAAVEYEGLPFQVEKSRHTTITGFVNDCEKYSEAAILGWCVVRVNAVSIDSGLAHDLIRRALNRGKQEPNIKIRPTRLMGEGR